MKCKKYYKDEEKYRAYRNRWKSGYRKRNGAFRYPGRSWTDEEKRLVWEHSIPDSELSPQIQRSVGAIQHMRSKIRYGID